MATFEELITRTITRLSMVPGYGVQTYAQDQIAEMIYHKFITVRDEAWWDDLMAYTTVTVDASGVPTDNIVREMPSPPLGGEIVIHLYSDIQHAWDMNGQYPLKSRPRRNNPNVVYAGGCSRLVGPHSGKVIQFFGAKDGEQFTLRYRKYYPMFDAADIVPMDEQVLILGAVWDYLADDGSNPQQIEKFRNLYIQRHDQLIRAENDEAINLGAL